MNLDTEFTIVPFDVSQHTDCVPKITQLLHRAYAPLLKQGLHYVASQQSDTVTLERLTEGQAFLAFESDQLVGTISLLSHDNQQEVPLYKEEGIFVITQFAVLPELQGRGRGRKLLEHAEARAREQGGQQVALDTAEHAANLIALYQRWGYHIVGTFNWDCTNYESVLLAKPLTPTAEP